MTAAIALQDDLLARFRAKRLRAFVIPGIILVYLLYVVVAFDVPGLAQRARLDNAAILLTDAVAHKVHVTRDNRRGGVEV